MKSTLRERPGQQKPCQRWRSSPSASPRTPQEVAGQTQSPSRQEPKQQLEARRALLLHETKTKTQGRERPTLRVRPWAPQQEEAGLRLAQDLPATLNTQTGEARRGQEREKVLEWTSHVSNQSGRAGEQLAPAAPPAPPFTGPSIFVPPLTSGHELWVVAQTTRWRVQVAEMSFLGRAAGPSLRDGVRSSE